MDERQPWDRQEGESKKAHAAFLDYCRMGPGRSQRKLLERYVQQMSSDPPAETPPTTKLNTLTTWSVRHNWQERVAAYDKEIEDEKNEELARRRREVLEEGIALDYERVRKLKRLAGFLEDFIYEEASIPVEELLSSDSDGEDGDDKRGLRRSVPPGQVGPPYPNVWLPDAKQIGGGENAERVDIVRFNAALIEQFRGVLDDLAKETGGRRTSNVNFNVTPDDLKSMSDDELDELERRLTGRR